MNPAMVIGGIPFYDTPSEIEGSPYWVDLWADVNGYKIGLQVKPQSYRSASVSMYMGRAKTSEEKGHTAFTRDFGGKVFIISPVNGKVDNRTEQKIMAERELLEKMPTK